MILSQISDRFSGRVFLSCISLSLICGWAGGAAGIWMSYANTDGFPQLSVQDIKWHFNGNPNSNRFASMSQGEMREHFTEDNDVDLFVDWSVAPTKENFSSEDHRRQFNNTILPIMEWDCLECHEPDGKAEDSPLQNYEEVKDLLLRDRGPSWESLAKFSHFHLLGIGTVVLLTGLLSFIFLKTREAGILSAVSSLGLVIHVAGWWLTKALAWPAPLVMIGGAMLGAGLCLSHFALLRRYWRKTK